MQFLSNSDISLKKEIKQKMDLQTRKNLKKCVKDAVEKEMMEMMKDQNYLRSLISQ